MFACLWAKLQANLHECIFFFLILLQIVSHSISIATLLQYLTFILNLVTTAELKIKHEDYSHIYNHTLAVILAEYASAVSFTEKILLQVILNLYIVDHSYCILFFRFKKQMLMSSHLRSSMRVTVTSTTTLLPCYLWSMLLL